LNAAIVNFINFPKTPLFPLPGTMTECIYILNAVYLFVTEAVEESGISEDHPLHSLVKSLSKRLLDARSDSTVKKYYYNKFSQIS
jgi:hypothetical protein